MAQSGLTTLGFDADDTLWHNERYFRLTEERFAALLGDHGDHAAIAARLIEVEKRNLRYYGFGIKGFVLSMIDTAIEVTEGRAPASAIAEILAFGRDMAEHPVEPLPHARETLAALHDRFRLVLITKGDLFDQERKLAASGLGGFFHAIEIVSDKSVDTYRRVFARHGDGPERAAMIGNSLKSDIAPALDAGAWGIYVPHDLTWELEKIAPPQDAARFRQIVHIGDLPGLLDLLR
ncbi:MAG: HAD family hydrolase [Phyllobacteriaceae bacterium]|nr:HAD family hydrolase [Phyllobacteriaceae bacterium]